MLGSDPILFQKSFGFARFFTFLGAPAPPFSWSLGAHHRRIIIIIIHIIIHVIWYDMVWYAMTWHDMIWYGNAFFVGYDIASVKYSEIISQFITIYMTFMAGFMHINRRDSPMHPLLLRSACTVGLCSARLSREGLSTLHFPGAYQLEPHAAQVRGKKGEVVMMNHPQNHHNYVNGLYKPPHMVGLLLGLPHHPQFRRVFFQVSSKMG
jgi:hypothetical protein